MDQLDLLSPDGTEAPVVESPGPSQSGPQASPGSRAGSEPDLSNPTYILTVYGVGYRFNDEESS